MLSSAASALVPSALLSNALVPSASVPSAVLAHVGQAPGPHDLWGAWNLSPVLVAGIVAGAVAYRRGRAGRRHRSEPWRSWAFGGALAAVVVALVSPLDALAGALASAHMVQHVLLLLVAAPLLALSAPSTAMLRGGPAALRQVGGRWRRAARRPLAALRNPPVVWLLHVGTIWLWHAGVIYDSAVADPLLHELEHATFLATGWAFWHVAIGARGPQRVAHGAGVLLVFTMALQSTFLSVLLTFARSPFYESYATTTQRWGLTPLADQQLAGVIMWVPAGAIYLAAGLALLAAWLRQAEELAPA